MAVLLLIAFFSTISGKPLDGFLMLTVAVFLLWDAAASRLRGAAASRSAAAGTAAAGAAAALGTPAARGAVAVVPAGFTAAEATPGPAVGPAVDPASVPARRTSRRVLSGLGWIGGGSLYAWVVGSFSRFSWPATIPVVALGCLMVAIGWQGPLRQRPSLSGQPLRRAWLWGVVLVAGGLWELSSLMQQPHLTTDSYAHPTISALTDPVLASHPGRSVVLGGWLLLGWFLAGR